MAGEAFLALNGDRSETFLSDGTRVLIERTRPRRRLSASRVSLHEARHGVTEELAGHASVVSMTCIAGKDYLGLTVFSATPSAAAMAAPKAFDEAGTGSDVAHLEHLGHSVSGAEAEARRILSGIEATIMIEEVASALDAHGSLSGSEIRRIMSDVKEGDEIRIQIFAPDGKENKQTHKRLKHSETMLSVSDIPRVESVDAKPTATHTPLSTGFPKTAPLV